MTNTIQFFENKEFGAIRTMSDQKGNTLFCGKDVTEALGYRKPQDATNQHVDGDDSVKRGLIDSLGGLCERG